MRVGAPNPVDSFKTNAVRALERHVILACQDFYPEKLYIYIKSHVSTGIVIAALQAPALRFRPASRF